VWRAEANTGWELWRSDGTVAVHAEAGAMRGMANFTVVQAPDPR